MSYQCYTLVLTAIGFPKDIANIIDSYVNWEYLDYSILTDKIIEFLLKNKKRRYINTEILKSDIIDILIKNCGFTFADYIGKIYDTKKDLKKDFPQALFLNISYHIIHKTQRIILDLMDNENYENFIHVLLYENLNEKGIKSGFFDKKQALQGYINSLPEK